MNWNLRLMGRLKPTLTLLGLMAFALRIPDLEATVSTTPSAIPLLVLEDYLTRAIEANPQLESFNQRYIAALQRIPQASALPDPMLQVTHFVEFVQTRTGPQQNVWSFGQKIPWFGTLSVREKTASAEAEAVWFAFKSQQLVIAQKVSVAFYEYAYTKEAIRITYESLELLKTLEPVVEEKVKAGADLNTLLRLKLEIGKTDDKLQTLQQKRVSQSAELSALLALPSDSGLIPWPEWEAPEVIDPDCSTLLSEIPENNPELQMLKRQISSAEARREVARLSGFPDITLGLSYIQIGEPVVNQTTLDGGRDPWGLTIGVNLPIWSKKNKASQAEALANLRSFENACEDTFNSLASRITSTAASLQDANRRFKLYRDDLIQLATQAVENSRVSYMAGRTGLLEVIDSERTLLDLQLSYWRSAADIWEQRIIIQTLTNQPIQGTFNVTTGNE